MLLDEPTANLDPRGRRELLDLIGGLGKTVIIATHDVNAAVQIADRCIALNRMVIADGSLRYVFAQQKLLEEANLEVPDVSRLFHALRERGFNVQDIPLSVPEGIEALRKLMNG